MSKKIKKNKFIRKKFYSSKTKYNMNKSKFGNATEDKKHAPTKRILLNNLKIEQNPEMKEQSKQNKKNDEFSLKSKIPQKSNKAVNSGETKIKKKIEDKILSSEEKKIESKSKFYGNTKQSVEKHKNNIEHNKSIKDSKYKDNIKEDSAKSKISENANKKIESTSNICSNKNKNSKSNPSNNAKAIKKMNIKYNDKRINYNENKNIQSNYSESFSDSSDENEFFDDCDSNIGLQEKMIIEEKIRDDAELSKRIKHKTLKEISITKIRTLLQKEEYNELKEYSFPYMRLSEFCYKIMQIKLNKFRKLYFYCPLCEKNYRNYSIPYHIFQSHFVEKDNYLSPREIAKGCASLMENEYIKIKNSLTLFSQLSILYKSTEFRGMGEWAIKADDMITDIIDMDIENTYFNASLDDVNKELSLIFPINKDKKCKKKEKFEKYKKKDKKKCE